MKANRAYTDAEDIDDETVETQIAAFDGFCQCQALGLEEPAEIKPDQNYARWRWANADVLRPLESARFNRNQVTAFRNRGALKIGGRPAKLPRKAANSPAPNLAPVEPGSRSGYFSRPSSPANRPSAKSTPRLFRRHADEQEFLWCRRAQPRH